MQKGSLLEFNCQKCKEPVQFSIFMLDKPEFPVKCEGCGQSYTLGDKTLKRQLQKFSSLCQQLVESEEILSETAVGIDVGEHHVKVPFKILLTRLNPVLDLMIGDHPLSIRFRFEPSKDSPSNVF